MRGGEVDGGEDGRGSPSPGVGFSPCPAGPAARKVRQAREGLKRRRGGLLRERRIRRYAKSGVRELLVLQEGVLNRWKFVAEERMRARWNVKAGGWREA